VNLRKLIREGIEGSLFEMKLRELETPLNEIDWESDFADVKGTCLNPVAVAKWLNEELGRLNSNKEAKDKDRQRRGAKDIIVTRGNLEDVIDTEGNVNLKQFMENILTEPDRIFDHNPKMEKSDVGRPQLTMNTGIPAIVGIVYDKKSNHFYSVSTCPGAGSCQLGCYARKAFYGMDDTKTMKLTRRLNLLLNDPERYKQRVMEELEPLASKLKRSSVGMPEPMTLVLRWNDAGDFFGDRYFNIAVDVTKELIDKGYKVKSYAYSKNAKYVIELDKNKDFVVNFSTGSKPSELKKVKDYDKDKRVNWSETVPKDLFVGIFEKKGAGYEKGESGLPLWKNENSPEELKDIIYNNYKRQYDLDRDSLKFTYELPQKESEDEVFNVIVLPSGDSDIGAQRKDVKVSFLLFH
jgi:hypothetical protein